MIDFGKITVTEITHVFTKKEIRVTKPKMKLMKERPFWGFSIPISGEIAYYHNQKEFISTPDNVIMYPMGATYQSECTKVGEFALVNFNTLTDFGLKEFELIKIKSPKRLISLFYNLEKTFMSGGLFKRTDAFSVLYNMLSIIAEEYTCANSLPIINRSIEYFEKNLSNTDLSVKSTAQHMKISEVYLRKLFKENLSVPPIQYIQQLRMQKAKILLSTTEMSINEISTECGYTNVYHFCRAFKTNNDCTPTEYRKFKKSVQY